MNTYAFRTTSDTYLYQDDAFAIKSFSKKVYHELYGRFLKPEARNCSVECSSDSAVLVRRHGASPELVHRIAPV